MSIYNIVLFVHVIGAIGYALSIGTWLLILLGFWRARRIEQVRTLIYLNDLSGPLGAGSAVLLLAAGLYLALTAWSLLTGWILVALISLLLMVPTNALLIAPRRRTLVQLAREEAPDGEISEALKQRLHDPVLWTMPQMIAALLLGLIFLMTTKPDLVGSLLVMMVALVLGAASSITVSRLQRSQRQEMSAQRGYHKANAGTK